MIDVTLPNGTVIKGVPEGATREQIKAKAIAAGLASESDFAAAPVDYASTKTSSQKLAGKQSWLDALAISTGRGINTIGSAVERATGLDIPMIEPERGVDRQALSDLGDEYPVTTTVGEVVGETLPFLPAGIAAGGAKTLGARVAGTAATGAAETGAASYGKGESVGDAIGAAGMGGIVAGGLEAAIPFFGRATGKIWRKLTGRSQGLTREALERELKSAGLEPQSITDDMMASVAAMPENADPVQALRAAKFREMGLTPTRAQVTRDAADFQVQQEATKTSGRIRDALENQEGQITRLFDERIAGTGGLVPDEGNSLVDTIVNRETLKDEAVSKAYQAARQLAPESQQIKLASTVDTLRELAPQNELTGGLLRAVKETLEQRGIIKGKGLKLTGRVDATTAEEIRQTINSFYAGANPQARIAIRKLKDTIDNDVMSAVGGDVFGEARKAKAEFERLRNRAKVSKFDSRKQNIVRDVLENKISPDTLANDTAFGKKWRSEDIAQLRDFTVGGGEGAQAWNDYRAEVLQGIRDMAFSGPIDDQGYQAITRAGLDRALNKIGTPKLKEIFTNQELKFLYDLKQITALREPVRGTGLGRGPSAQAISKLEEYVKTVPLAGAMIGDITDFNGRLAIRSSPDVIIKPMPMLDKAAAGVALGSSSYLVNQDDEANQ